MTKKDMQVNAKIRRIIIDIAQAGNDWEDSKYQRYTNNMKQVVKELDDLLKLTEYKI